MAISYLKKKWADITREERYFCAELFQKIKDDLKGDRKILKYLKNGKIGTDFDTKASFRRIEEIDLAAEWDVGYEACFYRDYLFNRGERIGGEKGNGLSSKRTFDLVLFSEDVFIIIEAKVYEDFKRNQMRDFDNDRIDIQRMMRDLGENHIPKIYILALVSEGYLESRYLTEDTKRTFKDGMLSWKKMYEIYTDEIFKRANDLRKQKKIKSPLMKCSSSGLSACGR